jgi:hypothetical protein
MIYIKAGIYTERSITGDEHDAMATITITPDGIQILNDDDEFVAQLTYEELRGIMAIMAAIQEKERIIIRAQAREN